MPRNTTVPVDTTWTQITDANITEITFQNIGASAIYIQGTVGAVAPGANDLGVLYRPGEGEAKRALSDLFPGVSGANRVYAKSASTAAQVFVSHA
jgi:hypothetical protein